jgi:hypothetical protein
LRIIHNRPRLDAAEFRTEDLRGRAERFVELPGSKSIVGLLWLNQTQKSIFASVCIPFTACLRTHHSPFEVSCLININDDPAAML